LARARKHRGGIGVTDINGLRGYANARGLRGSGAWIISACCGIGISKGVVSSDIMTVGVVSIATVIGIDSVVSIDTETEEVKEVEILKSPLLFKQWAFLYLLDLVEQNGGQSVVCPRLEFEASDELHDSRIKGVRDPSKVGAVDINDITNKEIGTIEHVERFSSELEPHIFFDSEGLLKGRIPIEEYRTVEYGAFQIANLARRDVEEGLAWEWVRAETFCPTPGPVASSRDRTVRFDVDHAGIDEEDAISYPADARQSFDLILCQGSRRRLSS
jgi:hypothetical protein